jgi:hypothetical protein
MVACFFYSSLVFTKRIRHKFYQHMESSPIYTIIITLYWDCTRKQEKYNLVETPKEHKTDLWLSRMSSFVSVVGVYVGLPNELSIYLYINSATYMCHIWRAFFGNQLTEVRDGCLFFWHCWPQLLFTIVSVWKSGDFWWLIYKYIDNSFGNPTYTPTTTRVWLYILTRHRGCFCHLIILGCSDNLHMEDSSEGTKTLIKYNYS